MTVLTPALLALGLAAAVPLLLHLLQRNRGPRVVFPALRYLRRAERDRASRIRLRQVLLLALRVTALLLLAAAAARPFLVGAGADHEPTSVVIVLDNSLSSGAVVGDRRVLDELRAAALAVLNGAAPGDRFWLIRAGQPWEPAVAGPTPAIRRAVLETRPSAGAAALAVELERAASILAGEPADRAAEIHLLSDLQATAFRGTAEVDPAVRVLVPTATDIMNRGVATLEVSGGVIPRAGERVPLSVTIAPGRPADRDAVRRGGPAAAVGDSVSLRLVADGRVRAAARVAAGQGAVLSLAPGPPGIVTGRVELDADALTADDRRYFALRISPPPAVAVAESVPFLEQALAVLADGGRLRRVRTGADVVVAPGARGVSAVHQGAGAVVLPPTSPLELAAANQRLAAAGVPWRYEAPRPGEARVDTAGSRLGRLLGDVRLRRVYGLTAPDGSRDSVLVRLRDGSPWAVTGGLDDGRYVLLGSPLVPAAGTIPTSAAMIPLLDHLIGGWASDGQSRAEHAPGDLVAPPAGDSVVGPGGTVPSTRGEVVRLTEPGIHRVYRDGMVVAAYAVNPPASESDLTRLATGRVLERIRSPDVESATAEDWTRVVFHRRLGREATRLAVALALAVLLVETLVAAVGPGNRGGRARAPTAPAREAG